MQIIRCFAFLFIILKVLTLSDYCHIIRSMRKTKEIKQIWLSYYTHTETTLFVNKKLLTENYDLHCHNHFEMEFVYSGLASENINGETVEVKKGTLYVLKPTDFHSIKMIEPLTITTVSFDYQILPKSLLQYFCDESRNFIFHIENEDFDLYKSLFDMLVCEYKQNELITNNVLSIIFEKLSRLSNVHDKAVAIQNANIFNAIGYINLHFNENPSVKDAANIAGYTPEYFSCLFKEITKKTFTQYLIEIKIANAKKLLALNNLSILDICLNCGFGSVSNFNRTFKSVVHCSPSQYRKNNGK